jgi:hypothetical protein
MTDEDIKQLAEKCASFFGEKLVRDGATSFSPDEVSTALKVPVTQISAALEFLVGDGTLTAESNSNRPLYSIDGGMGQPDPFYRGELEAEFQEDGPEHP